ncbi:MAG: hypothetical protein IJC80_02575, partial [Clostridia bacterium]|nr:hypothetical protein [Clostridia bacterium]
KHLVGEGLAPPALLGECHEIGGRQAPALRINQRTALYIINAPHCISSHLDVYITTHLRVYHQLQVAYHHALRA